MPVATNVETPEEDTLEAQGVSPDSEAPAPSTPASPGSSTAATAEAAAPERSSIISPLRGAPAGQPQPAGQTVGAPPVIVATPSAPSGPQAAEPTSSTVVRLAGAAADDIVYTPFALSIGDGFKFGCGIVLAVLVSAMGLALLAAIGFLIASLVGINVPIGVIGK